jgi:anti-anti-sigma regulatory factor
MLRITVHTNERLREVKVEGRITGAAVAELRDVCERMIGDRGDAQMVLDVGEVSFVDADGIELFRGLAGRDVVFANRSPFLAELLKEVVPCS